MARLATPEDFEQGGLYTSYYRYPFFAQRAEEVRRRFPAGIKILVAACGWGYLVEDLLGLGFDAWGCDAAQYAIDKSREVLTAQASERILKADITVQGDIDVVRAAANLSGKQKFSLCITEDVYPCMSDEEVTASLTVLRSAASALFHIATCGQPNDRHRDSSLNWKSPSEWKALIGNNEPVMNADGGAVL